MNLRQYIIGLCLGAIMVLSATPSAYASESAKESSVKAAILYNLARFSAWGDQQNMTEGTFNVCTLSGGDMQEAFDDLSGKSMHGRPLDIMHLENHSKITSDCQVLYISSAYILETEDLEMLDLSELTQKGILTVGETPDFLEFGGCISIHRVGSKLKFSINQTAMKAAHIKPSSKILQLSVKPTRTGSQR